MLPRFEAHPKADTPSRAQSRSKTQAPRSPPSIHGLKGSTNFSQKQPASIQDWPFVFVVIAVAL